MGTVPTVGSEEERAGNSSVGNEGKTNRIREATNPCHSLCEDEGGTAGAEGEGFATQQVSVGQAVVSHPVRQQPDVPMRFPTSGRALAAKMACPARNTPSSNAVTDFANREFIALRRPFHNPELYRPWHTHLIDERLFVIEGAVSDHGCVVARRASILQFVHETDLVWVVQVNDPKAMPRRIAVGEL